MILPYVLPYLPDLTSHQPLYLYTSSVQELDSMPAYHIHLTDASTSLTLLTAAIPLRSLPLFHLYHTHQPNSIPATTYRFSTLPDTSHFSAEQITSTVEESYAEFESLVNETLDILSDPELFPHVL